MGSLFFQVEYFYSFHQNVNKSDEIFHLGPESQEVVLVSAAHCNFICKVFPSEKALYARYSHLLKTLFPAGHGHFKHAGGLLLPGGIN